jgi:excinuclease ABC subunit A
MHDSPGPRLRPIVIRGARTHNLKSVDLTIAPRRLTVVTGVSGSGKSSLAFDTIYAEGQRRYVESLSAYARQFLERMERPDVDSVEGMPPAIAIRQKNSIRNPRSTVGTTTETHDYLRLLFARVGRTICRQCGTDVARETAEAVAERLAQRPEGARLLVGFELPIVRGKLGRTSRDESQVPGADGAREDEAPELDLLEPPPPADPIAAAIDALRRKGFARLLVDGQAIGLDEVDVAALADRAVLEVVVDRNRDDAEVRPRLTDAIEVAYLEGGGQAFAVELGAGEGGGPLRHVFSERFECRRCGIVY